MDSGPAMRRAFSSPVQIQWNGRRTQELLVGIAQVAEFGVSPNKLYRVFHLLNGIIPVNSYIPLHKFKELAKFTKACAVVVINHWPTTALSTGTPRLTESITLRMARGRKT